MKNTLFILLLFSFVLSQGTTAAEWLEIETDIRSIGMGGSQVASGRGISSSYNPANLAYIENQEAYFNKTSYLADISHSMIGYAKQLNDFDVVGVSAFFLDSGWIPETGEDGDFDESGEAGFYKVYNLALKGSYAKKINNRLKLGVSLKYIREDIADAYMQGLAFDIGSSYDLGIFGIVLGSSLTNIGPEVKFGGKGLEVDDPDAPGGQSVTITQFFPISAAFRTGLEFQLMGSNNRAILTNNLVSLIIAADAIKPLESYAYASLGAEASFKEMFLVRGGMHLGHDTANLSFGLGLDYKNIKIDYSLSSYGDLLGLTGQYGIQINF